MATNLFMENLKDVLSLIIEQNPKLNEDVKKLTIDNIYNEKDDVLLKFVITGKSDVKTLRESTVRKAFGDLDNEFINLVISEIKQVVPLIKEADDIEQYKDIKKTLMRIDAAKGGAGGEDLAHVALSYLPFYTKISRAWHSGKILGRVFQRLGRTLQGKKAIDYELMGRADELKRDIEDYRRLNDALSRAKDNIQKQKLDKEFKQAKKNLTRWINLGKTIKNNMNKDQGRIEKFLSKVSSMPEDKRKNLAMALNVSVGGHATSAPAMALAKAQAKNTRIKVAKTGVKKLGNDAMYYLRKLGDKTGATGIAQKLTGGSGEAIRNVGGVAALTLATLLMYGASRVYKNYLSKAARACSDKKGAEKEQCMAAYRQKGKQIQKADLSKSLVACKKASDPEKCKQIIMSKINKLK